MQQTNENRVFLEKRGRFFSRKNAIESKEAVPGHYLVKEGYRLATRMQFSERAASGRMRWFIDHVRELTHLCLQIGVKNTIRALRYAASPKVLYVDAIKVVETGTNIEKTFYSEYGLPLATSYDKTLLTSYGCFEIPISTVNVVRTYRVDSIGSTALELPQSVTTRSRKSPSHPVTDPRSKRSRWLVAGAGNFSATVLVPSILNASGRIVGVCSNIGASAEMLARAFNIDETFDSFESMLSSGAFADNLLIATPPYLHPVHLRSAIEAGYRIYCEKPVAVDRRGLDVIRAFSSYENCMIGFNRRFTPAVQFLVNEPSYRTCHGPKMITYIVNLCEYSVAMAKKNVGGGTTVGSCCHYLDLIEYLAGSRICDFTVQRYPDANDGLVDGGSFSCVCALEDGSVATLVFARAERPIKGVKEQICVAAKEFNAVISDFSEVLMNGKRRRFLFGTKGWQSAMAHFHTDSPLAASGVTPTLADGIHICELTLAIDEALARSVGNKSFVRDQFNMVGRV